MILALFNILKLRCHRQSVILGLLKHTVDVINDDGDDDDDGWCK